MAYVDPEFQYPNEVGYFRVLTSLLMQVYEVKQSHAFRLVNELTAELAELAPEERLLFFHQDVLNAASDLIDKVPSEREIDRSRKILMNAGWLPSWAIRFS
jgi:hypothetical protein